MHHMLSVENPVFKTFLFYASILIGKTIFMTILTSRRRIQKGVVRSPEDVFMFGRRLPTIRVEDDEDVERVRRAHLNDLENIPMFLFAGFIYVLTEPNAWIAINLFRLYTISRIVHTYVYAIHVFPQPTRGMAFGIGHLISWYMVIISAVQFVNF